MKIKKENMIPTEESVDEIHFDEVEILLEVEWMSIFEIFLNNFLDDEEVAQVVEEKKVMELLAKTLNTVLR
jgi:hypothetical protein